MPAVSNAKNHLRELILDAWRERTHPSLGLVVTASWKFLHLYLEKATLSELCDLIDVFEQELRVPVFLSQEEAKVD